MTKTALIGLALVYVLGVANASCTDRAGYTWKLNEPHLANDGSGDYIYEYVVDDKDRDSTYCGNALSHWNVYFPASCNAIVSGTCYYSWEDSVAATKDREPRCTNANYPSHTFKCETGGWPKEGGTATSVMKVRIPGSRIQEFTGGQVMVQSKSGWQRGDWCPSCHMEGPVCSPDANGPPVDVEEDQEPASSTEETDEDDSPAGETIEAEAMSLEVLQDEVTASAGGCSSKVNVCVALDQSGSICTRPQYNSQTCSRCSGSYCGDSGLSDDQCCANHVSTVGFAAQLATRIDAATNAKFALVEFSDRANVLSPLGPLSNYQSALDSDVYNGGWTITPAAIAACADELAKGSPEDQNVLILVTDGNPTKTKSGNKYSWGAPNNAAFSETTEEAQAVHQAGIKLIAVAIGSRDLQREYLRDTVASSQEDYLEVPDIQQLGNYIDGLATAAVCNSGPAALDDARTTDEGVAIDIPVLDNDTDDDGDVLTVTHVDDPVHGSAVINPDGTIKYTPDAGFTGVDEPFEYKISDGKGGTASAFVTVTVNAVNHAPDVEPDYATTEIETMVIIPVLDNDTDDDGPLTLKTVDEPPNGKAVIKSDGTIEYMPDDGFVGTDYFDYEACDHEGVCKEALVTVVVTAPLNNPPVANDDSATTDEGIAVDIPVLNNDSDPDGDTLSVSSVVDPPNGSVEITLGGIVKFIPDEGFSGVEVFDYTISDGNGGEATATINITINTLTVPDEPTVETRTGAKASNESSPINIVPGLDQEGSTNETTKTGQGGGDPHFKTWSGHKFDYHGECDLVLIDNISFADGKGLSMHARTTRIGYYSYIEKTALKIGDDVLEFENDVNNFWLNGKINKADKITVGGFDVWLTKRAVSIRLSNAGYHKSKAKIDFYERINGMPYFNVDGGGTDLFKGSLGMLGDWETGRMLARDGITENTDPTAHALEWQVRDTDPQLFSELRAPIYPAQCLPPQKILGKRLGDSHMLRAAERACSAGTAGDFDNCVFDVMATRKLDAAEVLVDIEADFGIAK